MSHKLILEKIALSAAIKDFNVYRENLEYYVPENFDDLVHKEILKYLPKYNDLILLHIDLQANLDYKKAGEKQYLEHLRDFPDYSTANIKKYLDKLVEQRQAEELKREYAQACLNIEDGKPFDKILDDHKKISTKSITKKEKQQNISELAAEIFESSIYNSEHGILISGLATGYEKLDFFTSGLQKKECTIIAGRPGMAKTALCTSIIDNISIRPVNKKHSVFISAEMSQKALITRLLCGYVKNTYNNILTGRLTKQEWLRYAYAYEKIINGNLTIYDDSAPSPLSIRSKLHELSTKKGEIDLVLVDYLQIMGSDKKHGTRAEEVSYYAQSMKEIAKEFNTHVIALSQLSRAVESRVDKRPIMSDLKESGSIEQAADAIFGLYREEYYTGNNIGVTEVICLKGRNIGTSTILLGFCKEHVRFENLIY